MNLDEMARHLPALLAALMVAVLFIQSGLDKILDFKGNLGWLSGHFSKTFLAPAVPLLLVAITVMELATGFLAAAGSIYFLINRSLTLIFISSIAGALSLLALFFGQRVAKDYTGAAVLVPYFLLVLLMMYLSNPYLPRS